MKRATPPPLATWILEHCIAGHCDEALAGDLLEGYSSGYSDGWYWRQVFAACAVSWSESFRARIPLLAFALIWSMMAPAWKVFTDGIQSAPVFDRILPYFGPVWVFPSLAVWLLLNSIFLWVGIFVFLVFRGSFRFKTLLRKFLLASLIFLPIYGVAWVWGCLYWYDFLAQVKVATTLLGQVADLQMLANVIRIPYFIALVAALWSADPRPVHMSQLLLQESPPVECSTRFDSLQQAVTQDPHNIKQFFGFMVVVGLVNAMLASILLGRLFDLQSHTFSTLFIRAILYVVIGVLAGVGGSWFYWKNPSSLFREHSPIPFPLFALICASGWIWVPSMAMFSDQLSPATAIVAAVGAVFLAVGLRNATFSVFAPAVHDSAGCESEEAELFSQSLYRAPWEAHGYVITFLLYAGGCALAMRLNLTAAALFALCAFLFVWKLAFAPNHELDRKREYRRAALRLACVAIPAVLVTVWALLDGEAHGHRADEMNAALAASNKTTSEHAHRKTDSQSSAYGLGGYESLILWPVPEKKQIVPPLPEISLLPPGTTQPLIIPFNGQYWYVQPPNKIPGPAAHQANGTPLGYEIESINSTPLVMDAHQALGAAIPVARCRQIQVEIENRDNRMGVIALAVLLTDAASPKNQVLYLGQQPVVSTEPEHFSFKSQPVFETLRFPVPASARIRRFDEITVMMLPDVEHAFVGPKIAIKQFQLFPR
jgi:hypothetical protein